MGPSGCCTSLAVDSIPKKSENSGIESTAWEVILWHFPSRTGVQKSLNFFRNSIPTFSENFGIESLEKVKTFFGPQSCWPAWPEVQGLLAWESVTESPLRPWILFRNFRKNFGIESTAWEVQQPEGPIQGQTASWTRQTLDSISEFPENFGMESTAWKVILCTLAWDVGPDFDPLRNDPKFQFRGLTGS